jgi:hypothetical protein
MSKARKPAGRPGMALAGGKKPQVRRKKGGWTAAKKQRFLHELAATCNISAALRKVRMSESGLGHLRRRSAAFRAQMAEVRSEAYARLELMTLERMMNGTVKTVTRADGSVDKTHEYPNHIALQLLRLHKDKVDEAEAEHDPQEIEAVRQRILRKLAVVRRRLEQGEEGGE